MNKLDKDTIITPHNLDDIVRAEGIGRCVETISLSPCCAQKIDVAIIGLGSFEDAEMLARKYGLSIELFSRVDENDHSSLWYRANTKALGPFNKSLIVQTTYPGNNRVFEKMSKERFYEEFVKEELRDVFLGGDESGSLDVVKKWREIYGMVEVMGEDEILVMDCEFVLGVFKKRTMRCFHNNNYYEIGVCLEHKCN